jgi:hypothetical protein
MNPKRILVASNCQSETFAEVLRFALTGCEVSSFHVPSLADRDFAEQSLDAILGADVLFSLGIQDHIHPDFRPNLPKLLAKSVAIESIDFNGFHPDETIIRLKGGGLLASPVGPAHSVIAAAGFIAGQGLKKTVSLFNALTYSRIGYFDAFPFAKQELLEKFRRLEFDISEAFERWMAREPFMYTSSHPKSFAVESIVKMACAKAGLEIGDTPYSDYFPDLLTLETVLPVYPEIARRLGVSGSYYFKPLSDSGRRIMSLKQYVEESWDIYGASDPAEWIVTDRVTRVAELFAAA